MVASEAPGNEKEYEDVDTAAWIARATAVMNRMSIERSMLKRADCSPERRAEALAYIKRGWVALAGRSTLTEDRLRMMQAVDEVALTNSSEGQGAAVLALLPPELLARLAAHSDQLRDLVLAWRVKTAGRRGRAGKWVTCSKVWEAATGEKTLPDVWERSWKEDRRRRRRILERGKQQAQSAQPSEGKSNQPPPN